MDAQQFLAEFGHIANAPGGVARLRELVLVLAMQGKLVPQTFGGTARELLRQVGEEKQMLVKAGVIRSPKPLPELSRSELFCSIPETWIWVRFGEIAMHNSGKTLDSMRNSGLPRDYITTSNLYWGRFDLSSVKQMLIREEELEKCTARKNDLLICEGGEAGRAAVWTYDYDVCFQNHIHRARFFSGINPLFAYRFFEKLNATGEINAHRKGIGISNMSTKALAMIPFPLPPIEEQSRIIAKVDELMALCDTLEGQQQTRRKIQNNLRKSILQDVASAQSSHELQDAWRNLEENFGLLFSEPEDVGEFKGLVLDLAVSGRLLNPAKRSFLSGAALLNSISKERFKWSQIAKEQELKEAQTMLKKLRTQRIENPIDPLPENWNWASLLQISQAVVDCHNKTAPYVTNGIHLVRTSDIRNGRMDLARTKKISEDTYVYWARRMPPAHGDIFFTREAPMGEAAIVPKDEKVCLGQRVMLIRLFSELYNNRFLLYVIMSPSFQARMVQAAIGMTVKHLRVGDVESLVVPVPPKEDQDHLVEVVDHIFYLCDSYIKTLEKRRKIAAEFARSAVLSIVGISSELDKEDSVKLPQTELIATVRLGITPDIKTQAPLATLLARHNGEMLAKDLWQRFGGEIDAFYAQLKTEVSHGWIQEPTVAAMREKHTAPTAA